MNSPTARTPRASVAPRTTRQTYLANTKSAAGAVLNAPRAQRVASATTATSAIAVAAAAAGAEGTGGVAGISVAPHASATTDTSAVAAAAAEGAADTSSGFLQPTSRPVNQPVDAAAVTSTAAAGAASASLSPRAVSGTAATCAVAAAAAAAGAAGAAGVSVAPRAARAASVTTATSSVAAADAATGVSSGSLQPTSQPVSQPAAATAAIATAAAVPPDTASSSPKPASHLLSQPARSPVKRAQPRVPPPHLPPDLPAAASEVQDLTSLSRVVTLLTTIIGKAVYDGKSVTASNKRLIALAAEETRRAVATFERLAPQPPPAPALAAATAGAGGREAVARAAAPPTSTAAPDAGTLSAELAACVKEVRLLRGDLSAAAKAKHSPITTAAPSYAQMAGRLAAAHRAPRSSPVMAAPTAAAPLAPPPTTPRPAIIVAPKEPVHSRQEAVSAWRDSISFKKSRFAPTRVQPLSNSKLRVEFETVDQRDETLARLRGSGKVTAEPARRTRPMFILKGISKEITSEELIGVLKHQNPGVGDLDRIDDIEIRFLRENKNPKLYNAVLTAEPGAWRKALSIERVSIDHQKVRVHNFTPFVQCRVCLQFGHTSRYCGQGTATAAPCAYCTSTAHNLVDCPEKERKASPRCFNCVARNERFNTRVDVAHTANSSSCPILRAMRARVESSIDYGS